ncbi:MAG: hypothetical protein AAFV53_38340 [Myxococcota bacterium]
MLPSLALTAVFTAVLSTAAAQDDSEEPEDEPVEVRVEDDSMIIYGELEERRRRQALEQDLLDLGYTRKKSRDGKTIYRPEIAWHPTVIVDDDGYVILKRSPVRFEPWVNGRTNLRWISCIPPFTIMCIKLSGQLVSPAKLNPKKQLVAETIDPELDAWRAVVVANAMNRRIGEEIPDMLEKIWLEGQPMNPSAPALTSYHARRAAILEFWSSRACTPEGEEVRELTADFVRYVIQLSDEPVTEAELAEANARNLCGASLVLDPERDGGLELDEEGVGQ